MKRCSRCGKSKNLDEFYSCKKSKDGKSWECKECKYAKTKEWRNKNLKRCLDVQREYNKKKREDNNYRLWDNNRSSINHKKKHMSPEKDAERKQRRRFKINNSIKNFTVQEWKDLCAFYNNVCLCCKKAKKLTVDHIVPLYLGGDNSIDNIQPLCINCNCRKQTKIIDYRPKIFLSSEEIFVYE